MQNQENGKFAYSAVRKKAFKKAKNLNFHESPVFKSMQESKILEFA